MKKSAFLILLCLFDSILMFSQVAVNTDGSAPDNSAILDVKSTTKGVLLPRMTLADLNAIANPADGLLVYCTDCGSNGYGALLISLDGTWHTLSAVNCMTPPSAPSEGSHITDWSQITWNWNSVSGATGYKWNTSDNYSSATDMGASLTKIEPGLTSETPYTRYVWAYNACGNSTSVPLTATTTNWECGDPMTINHVAGSVAPVDKTVTYGTVTNIPGETSKCWITSNLGADHQATAVNDATEQSAGWYWQFNRQQGYKHDGTTRTPNTTWITSINESTDWQTANDPCALELGNGWRLPTSTEWINIDASGGWGDWNGLWNSALKMHAAGYLFSSNAFLGGRGAFGLYWSSTQYNDSNGWSLLLDSGTCDMFIGDKAYGCAGRCLRD